jgi:hypothetical protein
MAVKRAKVRFPPLLSTIEKAPTASPLFLTHPETQTLPNVVNFSVGSEGSCDRGTTVLLLGPGRYCLPPVDQSEQRLSREIQLTGFDQESVDPLLDEVPPLPIHCLAVFE